jgi:hypothetical protein
MPSRAAQRFEQCRPPLRMVDRERDGRQIDHIISIERIQDIAGLGQIHQAAGGRALPPMKEASVAEFIGLDHVEAGQFALQPRNTAGADALRGPAREHLVAHGIVTEGCDVVDLEAETGEIDRGVQRVTAEAARIKPALGLLQLDHAFADAGHLGHGKRVSIPSLRAQRSNPALLLLRHGLLRRCAPRNDDKVGLRPRTGRRVHPRCESG